MTQSLTAPNGAQLTSTSAGGDDGPRDFRLISSAAVPLRVCAFRFADVSKAFAGRRLPNSGTYILALNATREAYPGESGNLCERLPRHFGDPKKGSADEIFILFGRDGGLDRGSRLHVEKRLMEFIDQAGAYRLLNEAAPRPSQLSDWETTKLDQALFQTLPLLAEAGCHFIDPNGSDLLQEHNAKGSGNDPTGEVPSVVLEKPNDDWSVATRASYAPGDASEVELVHRDLWARGYEALPCFSKSGHGEFVVAVGSEMRKIPGLVGLPILDARDQLVRTGTAVPIPGLLDRFWLTKPVAFPSRALAAAVLTGSQNGSDTWRPVLPASPPVV